MLLLQDVGSGRVAEWLVAFRGGTHRRCRLACGRVIDEPLLPRRPPRPLVARGRLLPGGGIEEAFAFATDAELVGATRTTGFVDDADVVTTTGEHEGQFGGVTLQVQLVDRLPGCDMVGSRRGGVPS